MQPNPNAMVVATVGDDGAPAARVVLCKQVVPDPGYIVFYTNYESRKGRDLTRHPRAAAVIHWDALHRQVRIEGAVVISPAAESDAYFASRPWQSRIGAWASAQSQPIASRADMLAAVARTAERFGTPNPTDPAATAPAGIAIPRPPHWGGYRLWADSIELWVEGSGRIHDRARWTRTLREQPDRTFVSSSWTASRLQP
jgi:pyridoxamine 5'-phosphate oxidase